LARLGVRGTFSQPGPSRPTVAVRLARTLCRTKYPSRRRFRVPGRRVGALKTSFGFWWRLSRSHVPVGHMRRHAREPRRQNLGQPIPRACGLCFHQHPIVASGRRPRSLSGRFLRSAAQGLKSSYKSAPLVLTAPRAASRWSVAHTAAAGYRPCSAVSRAGLVFVARREK
jgi:hypothetical protein